MKIIEKKEFTNGFSTSFKVFMLLTEGHGFAVRWTGLNRNHDDKSSTITVGDGIEWSRISVEIDGKVFKCLAVRVDRFSQHDDCDVVEFSASVDYHAEENLARLEKYISVWKS